MGVGSHASTSSEAIRHLFLDVLGTLLLDDRECVVLEHAHGLLLPLGLTRLSRLARVSAALATIAMTVVIIIAAPPVAIPSIIVARVTTGFGVEHVVVPVIVSVIAMSAVAVAVSVTAGLVTTIALVVVWVFLFSSSVRFVAF